MKLLLMTMSLLFSVLVSANPVPTFPFVIVTEKTELKVKPDIANVRFSILIFEKSSENSMQSLTKCTAQLLEVLKKYQIPISSLESTQIDKIARRASRDGAYGLDILGYELRQGFLLRISDLQKYPALMNEIFKLNGIQDLDAFFETEKEDEYKDKMIIELSNKARKKADSLAQAQSRKVKQVYGITTESNFGEAFAIFSLEYDPAQYVGAMSVKSNGMNLVMAVPEYIEVSQRITAIYELK